MANLQQLDLIRRSIGAWNDFMAKTSGDSIDFKGADLSNFDLSGANLRGVDLQHTKLIGANLQNANLSRANLTGVDFIGDSFQRVFTLAQIKQEVSPKTVGSLYGANLEHANFSNVNLIKSNLASANLTQANFNGAKLNEAYLFGATLTRATFHEAILDRAYLNATNLTKTSFRKASLIESNLSGALCVGTDFTNANIENSKIYGISSWDTITEGTNQRNLILSKSEDEFITVDDIEVAQFIYLLINNRKIRNVISTIAQKVVLILGSFSPERKIILDSIRTQLRQSNFVPILFDFEKSGSRNFTETIKILAGISRFVIADITSPKSIPQELQATVPDFEIPFKPIIQKNESPYSMFTDFKKYNWFLTPYEYNNENDILNFFQTEILDPILVKEKEICDSR